MVGLPQSTAWRLCYALSQTGLLVPGREADKLRAGPGVLTPGHAAVASAGIAELAYRPMKEIADRFGVAVSLAAPRAWKWWWCSEPRHRPSCASH